MVNWDMKKFQFHTIFVFQTFWLLNVGVFGLQFEDWSQQFSGKRFRPIVLVPRDSGPGPGSNSGGPPPKKDELLYKSNFIPNEVLFQKSKYKPPNRPAFWRYYDIKWALNFMHSRRHLVPDINCKCTIHFHGIFCLEIESKYLKKDSRQCFLKN